jgi:hypothetical protein
MTTSSWTEADSVRAREVWAEYERSHDLSSRTGQTAGIDPVTGRVWFGGSIKEVVAQLESAGVDTPLYFVRVGSPTYYRKGGRQ